MPRLTALALVAVLSGVPLSVPAETQTCDRGGWIGNCHVSNPGDRVDVTADATVPGSGGSGGAVRPRPSPSPSPSCVGLCRDGYSVGMLPTVTVADLASFVPSRPGLTGEPAGIGVVGLPTNVIASAVEHRIPGRLLGYDVVVRFVPAEYVFSYGDGSTRTTVMGGAGWAALGQAQFTPTATSHVFTARGMFTMSVVVRYAASVDFGSGVWRPVAGFVDAPSGGYPVRVVEAHTALVARTCLEYPRGPGC